MDEQNTTNEFRNTSTQKTVKLKPLVRKPVLNGTQESDSQVMSARPVLSNNTPTLNLKKDNATEGKSLLNNSAPTNLASKPASPILSSLNLKPKVATASLVNEEPASSVDISSQASEVKKDVDGATSSIKKVVATTVAPALNLSKNPTIKLDSVAKTTTANDDMNEATQAVKKVDAVNVQEVATDTGSMPKVSDDATVKIARPNRTPSNGLIPKLSKPADNTVKATTQSVKIIKPSVVSTSAGDDGKKTTTQSVKIIKPTTATQASSPTIKLDLKKPAAEPVVAPEVAVAPEATPQKDNTPEKKEEKKPLGLKIKKEEKIEGEAEVKGPPRARKVPTAIKPQVNNNYGMHGFFLVLTIIFVISACLLTAVQYLNVYRPEVLKKHIQLPFIENLGK